MPAASASKRLHTVSGSPDPRTQIRVRTGTPSRRKRSSTQARIARASSMRCLLYTSDAADERSSVDLGGRRIIKKKNNKNLSARQHMQH